MSIVEDHWVSVLPVSLTNSVPFSHQSNRWKRVSTEVLGIEIPHKEIETYSMGTFETRHDGHRMQFTLSSDLNAIYMSGPADSYY